MPNIAFTTSATPWPEFDRDLIAGLIYDHTAPIVRAMNMEGPCLTSDAEVLLFADFTRQWETVRIALAEYRELLHRVHGWGGNLNTSAR